MNKSILTGRWTKEPELLVNASSPVFKGTLAVDRKFKRDGKPTADFISMIAFGEIAEHIVQYYHKGMKANVIGHIQTGSYEKDGQKHYTTDVIIDEIEFGESKNAASANGLIQNGTINDNEFVPLPDDAGEEFPF